MVSLITDRRHHQQAVCCSKIHHTMTIKIVCNNSIDHQQNTARGPETSCPVAKSLHFPRVVDGTLTFSILTKFCLTSVTHGNNHLSVVGMDNVHVSQWHAADGFSEGRTPHNQTNLSSESDGRHGRKNNQTGKDWSCWRRR